MTTMQLVGAVLFGCALVHTFAAKAFGGLARRHPRHAGLFHLLGEVEVVFGFWAFVLVLAMALLAGGTAAIAYAESRHYTEPLFVFVVMVVAASKPVLESVRALLARAAPVLAPQIFRPGIGRPQPPEWLKYGALGMLFVNVSIGGTLTSYAAPPVLMVAGA